MKLTPEQLATVFFPIHDIGDVSDMIAADGTDVGAALDSGDYEVENPYAQLLAKVYETMRDAMFDSKQEEIS